MRVLVATHNYPRFPGDPAGAYVRHLALAAAAAGVRVEVVCPHAAGVPPDETENGIRVRRFRSAAGRWAGVAYSGDLHRRALRSPRVAAALPFFLWAFHRALAAAIAEARPDVVHAHWWVPAGLLALLARRPYIVTSHGSDVRLLETVPPVRRLARFVYGRAGAVTAASAFLADDIARWTGVARERIAVTPMPVDVAAFAAGAAVPRAAPPRVLYAGNLVPSKGVDILIQALRHLRDRGVTCRLRLVGEGPALPALRALAEREGVAGDIDWSPFVPQSAMPAEYGAATVTVLPTRGRAEGLGLGLVEALLAGAAVVGTPAGGIPEVVVDGETGLLARDGDPAHLAAQLERLLTDAALRARLTAAGRERVSRHHSLEAASRRMIDLYRAVADRHPPR